MNFTTQFLNQCLAAKTTGTSTLNHVIVLAYLAPRERGVSMADIARLLKVTPASATGIADTLEGMGMIKRAEWTDGRRVALIITARGRDALDVILTPTKHKV